jgi:hypothetical protein
MSRLKEQRAWDSLRDKNLGRLLLKRVENTAGDPLADVIGQNRKGTAFWLELKALDKWPARATTQPLKGKFEPGQIPFAKEWNYWGGFAFVLLRVGVTEWFLLWPRDPRQPEIADMTSKEIREWCAASGLHNIIEFLEEIE